MSVWEMIHAEHSALSPVTVAGLVLNLSSRDQSFLNFLKGKI